MQADIAALRADVDQLRQTVAAAQAEMDAQSRGTLDKFEQMGRALQEFNQSARLTDVDFGSQVERIIRDVQELRGAVEVTDHRIGETETRLQQTLAERIASLQQPSPEATDRAGTGGPPPLPKDKKEALVVASGLLKANRVTEGRVVLRELLRQWPRELGVSDEATYRLGESYFSEKKYDAALREYIKIVDKFSRGNLVDDAYYRIGLCSIELGHWEDAQTFLTELVTNHPKSPLLKAARGRLDEVARRIEQAKTRGPAKKRP